MPHHQEVHLRNRTVEEKAGRKELIKTGFNHISGNTAYGVIDDTDDQTTAGTGRDVFIISKLLPRDLETVTARTRIVVDGFLLVPAHILDFDLVVVRAHGARK